MAELPEKRFDTNINLEGHDLLNLGSITSLIAYLESISMNGKTLFAGSSGNFTNGQGVGGVPPDAWRFLLMNDITANYNNSWDANTNRYSIPVSGSYLIVTKVAPAQGTQNQGHVGKDFYCGPATEYAGDAPDGLWGIVGASSRPGIKISTAKHYNAGDRVGLAHYQENGGWFYLCSMSIVLLQADKDVVPT